MKTEVSTADLLEILHKAHKLGITTSVAKVDGDFVIDFGPEILGRSGQVDSITITAEGAWKGYGWTLDSFTRALDNKVAFLRV